MVALTPNNGIDTFMKSPLVKAVKEAETHNTDLKHCPSQPRTTPLDDKIPFSCSKIESQSFSNWKVTANTGHMMISGSFENEKNSDRFQVNKVKSKTKE